MTFLSIITATLNNGKYLIKNIESVLSQSYKNFEHIVIDGGSLDNTVEILQEYEKRYALHWISEPDEGIADALNKGLRIATGHYIIVLQADDALINAAILESAFASINKSVKDIYSFPVLIDHPSRGLTLRSPIRHLWYNRIKFIFLHQGCFVKRRVFDEIGEFNTSYKIAMDYDFFYRALKHKCSVKFCDISVALMRGNGIGTVFETAFERLKEEQMVQAVNEDNIFWRTAQRIFWRLYLPYKEWQLIRSQ